MKTCDHCDGDLLRHGITRYKSGAISIRYRCRDCQKTFTAPIAEDEIIGKFNYGTGRPTLKDWRFNGLGVPEQQSAA